MKDVIFINSHPIQYFAPMYKYMNEQGVNTKAWYCSDESIKGGYDNQFGTEVKWDIPLLEGYEYRFFKNYSPRPSHFNGFFGLMNFGMIKALFEIPKSVIVVHGWHYFSHLFILLLGKLKGHTICIRCDIPLSQEKLKKGWKQRIKKFGLRTLLFPRISYFLHIGNQNKMFYKSYQIPESRLLFCPYAVDNERFRKEYQSLQPKIDEIRHYHKINEDGFVFVFTAKYIEKKRPLDLLQAFKQLNNPKCWLIMVGEGELRPSMEAFIQQNNLKNVILTGFVNQSKIAEYYAISDVFIMCSGEGENWGLSANEALNFDLPLLLSHLTGCSDDLVKEGKNGYVFTTGNTKQLYECMQKVLLIDRKRSKYVAELLAKEYSYHMIAHHLRSLVIDDSSKLK